MKKIKKILVPTDFSSFSFSALEYVGSLASLHGATVYLLHVESEPFVVPPFPNVDFNTETVLRDTEKKSEELLHNVIAKKMKHIKNVVPMIRKGDAADVIVDVAQEIEADLIVMATHGRTGLSHILVGSVAEKVVRHSTVPVLTVKPAEVQEGVLEKQDVEEQLHF